MESKEVHTKRRGFKTKVFFENLYGVEVLTFYNVKENNCGWSTTTFPGKKETKILCF